MPEGPEVRKYADALDGVLKGRNIQSIEARTREAKKWLNENGTKLVSKRILRVTSHGKHLLGYIQGGFYFHSHLMMWGRWETFSSNKTNLGNTPKGHRADTATESVLPPEKDRRERARVVVEDGGAILMSAPIFNVGEGDPYEQIENLRSLGPDVLPIKGKFNTREFQRRLLLPEHLEITIGAALLNQRILAGLGNYLRAEVLFNCRLNPWLKVGNLKKAQLQCLSRMAPALARRAYLYSATADEEERARMTADPSLVYQPDREYGTRHLVFRRTNLPCLYCGTPIKQLRQPTYNADQLNGDGDESVEGRTRIVYFCPSCQRVESH